MVKNHLKATKAPITWTLKRKNVKFVIRPLPGKQMKFSMPIALVFKNLLNKVTTTKEVKYILNNQEVLVDGKRKYDVKDVVGLFDVLSLKKSKENFRILLNEHGKLIAVSIDNKEAGIKLQRVEDKTIMKKGLVQLNLSDG